MLTFGAPIRDAQGRPIGALVAVVDLHQPNFLDRITNAPSGMTADFMLVAPGTRLVVTASDKSRIIQTAPPVGVDPMMDRIMQGLTGSAVLANARGTEVLASAMGVPSTGWFVATSLPAEEAFAPADKLQHTVWLVAALATLLIGGTTWWVLRRQLAPMIDAAQILAAQADTAQRFQPLPVRSNHEVGQLIQGFNHLLDVCLPSARRRCCKASSAGSSPSKVRATACGTGTCRPATSTSPAPGNGCWTCRRRDRHRGG